MSDVRRTAYLAALFFLFSTSFLAGPLGTSTARHVDCPGAYTPARQSSVGELKTALRCEINRARGAAGLWPLEPVTKLRKAAKGHAKDMKRNRFFSHTSSDGSGLKKRVRRTGFLKNANRFALGEDIGWGRGLSSTPARIVDMWLDSPAHAGALLSTGFDRLGIGVARGRPYGRRGSRIDRRSAIYVADLGWRRP